MTPLPSPTPRVDAVKAFLAAIGSRSFAASTTLTGTLSVGAASYPITGTYDLRGADNRQSITIAVPGATQVTDSMTVGGVTYVKREGLWFEKPAAVGSSSNADLASSLRSVLDLVDVGTVTRNGRTLHHLEPLGGATIPLSAIGASDPTGDGVATLDFYAEADGTPAAMTLTATWTQTSGKTTQRASMTIDYRFSNVGGQVVIAPPLQVWRSFKSKRFGYSMSHPVDWEVEQSPAKGEPDSFVGAEGSGVWVYRVARQGYSLNSITSGYVKEIKRTSKASVSSNKATTIDGSKARRLEFTGVFDGTREWDSEVIVVRGKYVYFIVYSSLEKLTPTDRATFDAFLSTVDLP